MPFFINNSTVDSSQSGFVFVVIRYNHPKRGMAGVSLKSKQINSLL